MEKKQRQAPKPRKRGVKRKPKQGLGFWVEWTKGQAGETKVNAKFLGNALFGFFGRKLMWLGIVIVTITLIVLVWKGILTFDEAKKIFGLIGVL